MNKTWKRIAIVSLVTLITLGFYLETGLPSDLPSLLFLTIGYAVLWFLLSIFILFLLILLLPIAAFCPPVLKVLYFFYPQDSDH